MRAGAHRGHRQSAAAATASNSASAIIADLKTGSCPDEWADQATILDLANTNLLMQKEQSLYDPAGLDNPPATKFRQKNGSRKPKQVDILVGEFVKPGRR
jgi:hypothetical protein